MGTKRRSRGRALPACLSGLARKAPSCVVLCVYVCMGVGEEGCVARL